MTSTFVDLVAIGTGNSDGTKPLHEPMLIYNWYGSVAHTKGQFRCKCSWYQFVKCENKNI